MISIKFQSQVNEITLQGITRNFPGDCCWTTKTAKPHPNFRDIKKWIKHI